MVWILDLDGVIWLAERPIEGSPEAVGRLRQAGEKLLFLTNNSSVPVGEVLEKLSGMGIEAERDEVVTSAQAAASMLEPGITALLCAGPGVREALEERDVNVVREGEADAVVVGFHKDFDFERLCVAFRAVRDGARLIGTNDDATYPTPDGAVPGGGSILAAVATAAGVEAEVAGKPHEPMAELVRARVGEEGKELSGVLVGDRPSTDGLMAKRLGVPFALVWSGVTSQQQEDLDPAPDMTAEDLASLVDDEGHLNDT